MLNVIKKKLIRNILIKKISDDKYGEFWKEYSTNIKLGVIEDTANRTRLAKLHIFTSLIFHIYVKLSVLLIIH